MAAASTSALPATLPTWAPGYVWSQTEDSICLSFEIPPHRSVIDVTVAFSQHELFAGVEGEPLRIAGALHHAVLPSNCTWVMESRKSYNIVDIHLQKSVPISWPYPIKEDGSDGTPMDAQSEVELARHYESAGNLDSAMVHMRQAAEKGSEQALLTLAKLHHVGLNTAYRLPQNLELAAELYNRAAALGSSEALYLRGTILQEQGRHADAVKCFRDACRDDAILYARCLDRSRRDLPPYIVASFFNLGVLYQDGSKDLPVNVQETIKWWTLAADQQFAPALFNLGVLYLNGQGVARDEAKAQSLFERANKLNAKLAIPHISASASRRTAPPAPHSPASAAAAAASPSAPTAGPAAGAAVGASGPGAVGAGLAGKAAAAPLVGSSPSAFHSPRPHGPDPAAIVHSPGMLASPSNGPPRTSLDDLPDFKAPGPEDLTGGTSMWQGLALGVAAGLGVWLFGRFR